MNDRATSGRVGAGWRAKQRPVPGFGHTLGAAGGVFAVAAVIMLADKIASDEPRLAGTIASAVLVVVALFVTIQIRRTTTKRRGDDPGARRAPHGRVLDLRRERHAIAR